MIRVNFLYDEPFGEICTMICASYYVVVVNDKNVREHTHWSQTSPKTTK
jgi:hypothetical protein